MKLIEALKELPLIKKKIEKKQKLLQEYSSYLQIGDVKHLKLPTEQVQEQEVQSLIQGIKDLLEDYSKLKEAIARTNLKTKVKINNEIKSITEWITIRQELIQILKDTYGCLNNKEARLQKSQEGNSSSEGFLLITLFDPLDRDRKVEDLLILSSRIDTTLEIINATQDLILENS